jgi:hypothetical protein
MMVTIILLLAAILICLMVISAKLGQLNRSYQLIQGFPSLSDIESDVATIREEVEGIAGAVNDIEGYLKPRRPRDEP